MSNVVDILVRSKDATGPGFSSADSRASRLGHTLSRVGKIAALGVGAGAVIASKALFDMGQKAGDLNETISKTNQIFGNKNGNMLVRWAQDTDKQLGMSKQTALDAAATFGIYGKAAGKTGGDLRAFSQINTALAADLASFHNSSPEEAIEALGSAFRGEAEPMRKFGVMLDDASMRQEALRMGLVKTTTEALTPQQKVLAAQALIMKQTTDAQGDFARTSGGLANQQRILKAQVENVQVSIGQKLLPVMLKAATFTNTAVIPALGRFGDFMSTRVVPVVQRLGDVVRSVFGGLSGDVEGPLRDVQSIVASTVSIITSLWDRFGGTITAYTRAAFRNLQTIIGGALDVIAGVFKVVASVLKGDWSGAWDGIKQIARGGLQLVTGIIRQGLNLIKTIFKLAWQAVTGIAGAAWDGIKALAARGAVALVEQVRSIPGRLRGMVGSWGSAGKALIGAFVDGLKNAGGVISGIAGNVWSVLKGLLNAAIDRLNAALEFTIDPPGPGQVHVNPTNIPHLARGGIRSGLAMVGERGRELVRLPSGSSVIPNGQTERMLAGGGRGDDRPLVVQLVVAGRVLEQVLIEHVRATGRPLQVRTL